MNISTYFCLFLFFNSLVVQLSAQSIRNVSDKTISSLSNSKNSTFSNLKNFDINDSKSNSSSLKKVNPRISQNYESLNVQNSTYEAKICGMNDFWHESSNDHRTCNYYGITDNPDVRDAFIPSPSDNITYLKLAVHVFADNDGNNSTTNIENIEAQIYTLNEAFYNYNIQFVAWYQIHNNSNFLVLSSEQWFSGAVKEQYNQDPTIYHNLYVCDTGPEWGILGVSTFPWMSDAISIYGGTIIDKDWFGGPRNFNNVANVAQKTIVHELGHALGLWHTHRGSIEVEECSDCYEGADSYSYELEVNRDIVGDLCSDTKGTSKNFLCSDPTDEDCQENEWANTDFHNYMGYADDDCYNYNNLGFSSQQAGRMHGWINDKYEGIKVNDNKRNLLSVSFEDYGLPNDWLIIDNNDDGNEWFTASESGNNNSDLAYNGDIGLIINSSNASNDDYIITPLLSLPDNATTANFTFWAKSLNSNLLEDFVARVSTDGSNFNVLEAVYEAPNSWSNYSYDLSSFIGQDIFLAIQCISSFGNYLVLDDIEVEISLGEEQLSASFMADRTIGAAPHNVNFNDLSSGSPNSWHWNFGDGEISNEQNPSHIYQESGVYTVSLEITNDENTNLFIYENYIKVTDILVEDFESGIPDNWLISNANNDNVTWALFSEASSGGADLAFSGDLSLGITFVATNYNNDWLITDEYELPTNSAYLFEFMARSFNASFLEEFNVLISTEGANSYDNFELIQAVIDCPFNWTNFAYDLTSYAGQSITIAIQSVSYDNYYLFVDDFSITSEYNFSNEPPSDFFLQYPENISIITDLTPTLRWDIPTDPDDTNRSIVSYHVYLDTNLTSVIPDTVTTNSYTPEADLLEDAMYNWKVIAVDNDGGIKESTTWSFTTNSENSPPTEFSLVEPLNNAILDIFNPPFCWEETTDPDFGDTISYTISLGKYLDSMSVIYVGTYMESCFYETMGMVEDNSTYYWNVVASDNAGAVSGPDIQTFTINTQNNSPGLATLIAPLQGSIQTDIRPSFYWSEGNDPDPFDHVIYSIEWWSVNETDVMFIEDVDTNTFTPEFDLSDNAKFGWRVTSMDIEGLSSMTDSSYFFTDAFPEPPLAFSTVYPENNAEGLGSSIDFVWSKTTDPDPLDEVTYQLVYGTDWQDSSTYVFSDITIDTSISILVDNNNQYYWIVVARDADGFIVGSNNDTPNMVTVGTLSVDNNTMPTVFALHQNYPNPFNPTTKISYDLPNNEFVSIYIYNVMGRKIKSLINANQEAGYRSLTWNATDDLGQSVSAGMYIYTIQAGEYRQTRKMVLLK